MELAPTQRVHCVKRVHIRSYSSPYFPALRSISPYSSKCGKIRTRITQSLPPNWRNQEKSENYKTNYGKYGKVNEINCSFSVKIGKSGNIKRTMYIFRLWSCYPRLVHLELPFGGSLKKINTFLTQPRLNCSKLTIETVEQDVKYV